VGDPSLQDQIANLDREPYKSADIFIPRKDTFFGLGVLEIVEGDIIAMM